MGRRVRSSSGLRSGSESDPAEMRRVLRRKGMTRAPDSLTIGPGDAAEPRQVSSGGRIMEWSLRSSGRNPAVSALRRPPVTAALVLSGASPSRRLSWPDLWLIRFPLFFCTAYLSGMLANHSR